MKQNNIVFLGLSGLTLALSIFLQSNSFASAFQLFEANTSSTQTFGAGEGALGEDASASYFNPAAMSLLDQKSVVYSQVGVQASTEFTGTVTFSTTPPPLLENLSGVSDGSTFAVLPSLHVAVPINDDWVGGLSIASPFGLATEYDEKSQVRHSATKSKLATVDISPTLAYRINDMFAIGAGLNLQYAQVDFNSIIGVPNSPATDSTSHNKGSDVSVGFNAGGLMILNKGQTRVGLNYRSSIRHDFTGTSTLTGPIILGTSTNPNLASRLTFPWTVTLSGFHKLNPRWDLLGSIAYTHWSVVKNIVLRNVQSSPSIGILITLPSVTLPQNFKNTWRFMAGGRYQVNDDIQLRGGLGFDMSPVNAVDRNLRLPDGDRFAMSVGVHYVANDRFAFDFGYTRLFTDKQPIANTQTPSNATIVTSGHSDTTANLFGMQVTASLG